MKVLIVFCAFFAIICAAPSEIFYTAVVPQIQQYHAQGSLGEYSYGYNAGLSGKVETRSVDGITRGSYSYVDSDGILQTVEYTADAMNGFRAAATNLPKGPIDNAIAPEPVKETPEVAQARADHMAAFNQAATRALTEDDSVETMTAPIPMPVAQIAPINAGLEGLRATEIPRTLFGYHFTSPAIAYAKSNLYVNPSYFTLGSPLLEASPYLQATPYSRAARLENGPAAVAIHPILLGKNAGALELESPTETPEVAMARAVHLAAVEKEKARIAKMNFA